MSGRGRQSRRRQNKANEATRGKKGNARFRTVLRSTPSCMLTRTQQNKRQRKARKPGSGLFLILAYPSLYPAQKLNAIQPTEYYSVSRQIGFRPTYFDFRLSTEVIQKGNIASSTERSAHPFTACRFLSPRPSPPFGFFSHAWLLAGGACTFRQKYRVLHSPSMPMTNLARKGWVCLSRAGGKDENRRKKDSPRAWVGGHRNMASEQKRKRCAAEDRR